MTYRLKVHPLYLGLGLATVTTILLSSFLYSETVEFLVIAVVLALVLLASQASGLLIFRTSHELMATMVGGTAGGLFGGLIVFLLMPSHCDGHAMTMMTDSMAGMIGCTLAGWRHYR